jgi:hypothetical protein
MLANWVRAAAGCLFSAITFADFRPLLAADFVTMKICPTYIPGRCVSPQSEIYILGEIIRGDAQKFEAALSTAGPEIMSVQLRSPGGSVSEAYTIGRVIRQLHLSTNSPSSTVGCARDEDRLGRSVFCRCVSACFLIHAGGEFRFGDEIYIHRIRFDSDYFGSLRPVDAATTYRLGMAGVRTYLEEMGLSPRFYDRMLQISSKSIEKLTADEVAELSKGDPAYDEWLDAKCPRPFGQLRGPDRCAAKVGLEARYDAFSKMFNKSYPVPDVCVVYPAVCR